MGLTKSWSLTLRRSTGWMIMFPIIICSNPDGMFICVCNAITDREIRECAELGAVDVASLKDTLGLSANCGKCACAAAEILRQCARERAPQPA